MPGGADFLVSGSMLGVVLVLEGAMERLVQQFSGAAAASSNRNVIATTAIFSRFRQWRRGADGGGRKILEVAKAV